MDPSGGQLALKNWEIVGEEVKGKSIRKVRTSACCATAASLFTTSELVLY